LDHGVLGGAGGAARQQPRCWWRGSAAGGARRHEVSQQEGWPYGQRRSANCMIPFYAFIHIHASFYTLFENVVLHGLYACFWLLSNLDLHGFYACFCMGYELVSHANSSKKYIVMHGFFCMLCMVLCMLLVIVPV
jgi:hypothetical protein